MMGAAGDPETVVHAILSEAYVPKEVRVFIYKHELLHLEVRPRRVGKRLLDHPPEFCERERELCPEGPVVWRWIWQNLGECLRHRPRLEGVEVTREWRRVRYEMRLKDTPEASPLCRVEAG